MSIKSFLTKKALQLKGVSKEDADRIAEEFEKNPGIADQLKKLEGNKEVKELFEKIQKETEALQKTGIPDAYAQVQIMSKYKNEIMKHQEDLAPLIQLMMGMRK